MDSNMKKSDARPPGDWHIPGTVARNAKIHNLSAVSVVVMKTAVLL